jgi:hypothetical protein
VVRAAAAAAAVEAAVVVLAERQVAVAQEAEVPAAAFVSRSC